jgi:hypothetical protein
MSKETIGVTLNRDDIAEITLGICEDCANYAPFLKISDEEKDKVFKCLTCGHEYKQLVNGKIQFLHLDKSYKDLEK